jgi:hypothetical protein
VAAAPAEKRLPSGHRPHQIHRRPAPHDRTHHEHYEAEDGATAVEPSVRPDAFAAAFAADLPSGMTDVLAVVQRPVTVAALHAPAPAAAWRTLLSRYVVAAADRATPPDAQRFMAARAGALTVELDASDAVALSCPTAVVADLRAAAVASRAAGGAGA